MSECRSCHAEILWCVTESGARIPLDPIPSPTGVMVKLRVDPNGDKVVHRVTGAEKRLNTKPLYSTHFETCPFADEHRRKKS